MRQLTFEGFLSSYVRHLAGRDTLALPALTSLLPSEPRLAEPLLLWAAMTGRAEKLQGLLRDREDLQRDLTTLTALAQAGRLESALTAEDASLSAEYAKVWHSFVVRRDAPSRDARLKLRARDRALQLEAVKDVTRYRMAKDLGLNPGNLHAYLAQGNVSKLSLHRALQLVDYLEAA